MKSFLFTAALATAIAVPAIAQVSPSTPMPGARGMMGGKPPMMRERMEQRMEQLTPAQREEMQKRMEARKAKWDAMTPEQQQQIRTNFQKRMEARKAEWDAMTPEQRTAKMDEMKKIQSLPADQRAAALKAMMKQDGVDPDSVPFGPPPAPLGNNVPPAK